MSISISKRDSMQNTIFMAFAMSIVFSIIVSSAAVFLKPMQEANKAFDRNKNILIAAGLFDPDTDDENKVDGLIENFEVEVVDFNQARALTDVELAEMSFNKAKYNQRKASKDPALSIKLSSDQDIASIRRRANLSIVYLVKQNGQLETVVLPVHGYGLWSTLYGFIALEGDLSTVKGITFYQHKETPGLGGEVDNLKWKASWQGKSLYNGSGDLVLKLAKGRASNANEIDGLSGATLTSNGVTNLVHFWLGENAFGPYLANLAKGGN